MLKNSLIYYFCGLICLCGVTACAVPARVVTTEVVPAVPPTVAVDEVQSQAVKMAEADFHKGEGLFLAGDIAGAKEKFNRVIDTLLEAGETKQLKKYISRIAKIELSYLKDGASQNADAHETFLDEALSTPLFEPSPLEIQQIQEKINLEKPQYTVPVIINAKVVSFIKAFQNIRKKNIQHALNRSAEYVEEFKRIFASYDLPEDLAYLPIIESGFRVDAISRARAQGVWQFMGSTARRFGLRVDWVVDERKDPFKAAHAAAKYLKLLYEQFDDWYLALACYNSGTRRISRAIGSLKTKDFFEISQSKFLRPETRNYVPAYLASLIIAKDPQTYGFAIETQEKRFDNTKTIEIISPANLQDVANLLNISYDQLQDINPELLHEFTPFDMDTYTIRVPEQVDPAALSELKRLPPTKHYFTGWHEVKRGDSLYSIARKFNTSVNQLKHANKLRSNAIKPGKRLLIPRSGLKPKG